MISVDLRASAVYASRQETLIMRSQFVLDDQTEQLLNELAAARAGNRSFVVREAIHLYANLEEWLDTVEADPGLQGMIAGTAGDIEAGRVMNSRQLQQRRNPSKRKKLGRGTQAPGRR